MKWKDPESTSISLLDRNSEPLLGLDNLEMMKISSEAALIVPFSQMCDGDIAKLITINTTNRWQLETPAGSIWQINQVTKKGKRLRTYLEDIGTSLEVGVLDTLKEEIPLDLGSWELTIMPPPVAGSRPSIRLKIEGTKQQALLGLTLPALFMLFLRANYEEELDTFSREFIESFPPDAKPFFKEPVDIRGLGPLYSKSLSWGETQETITKLSTGFKLNLHHLHFITVLLLHETCIYNNRKSIEEGAEMAKNSSGNVWWLITGGQSSVGKVTNSLTKDRHFIVLDSANSIYLRIQKNENTFTSGIVKTTNCKLQPTQEPTYSDTLCGKRHTDVVSHSRRCQGCARIKENKKRAQQTAAVREAEQIVTSERIIPNTSSPDGKFTSGMGTTLPVNPIIPPRSQTRKEEEEWKSKNGAIITIKGPEVKDVDDFELLAQEYEEMSVQLLSKATEYDELAKKLRNFGKPSQAVQEAEIALVAARQRDEDQRAKDKADIIAAITSSKKGV